MTVGHGVLSQNWWGVVLSCGIGNQIIVPEHPMSPRQFASFFYVSLEKSNLCQLRGTGALLVLTFLTSAVANRVANRILLARDLVKNRWVRMIQGPTVCRLARYRPFQVPMAKHSLFLSLATSAAQFLFRDTWAEEVHRWNAAEKSEILCILSIY